MKGKYSFDSEINILVNGAQAVTFNSYNKGNVISAGNFIARTVPLTKLNITRHILCNNVFRY